MADNLVIVESPAKARTIQKFLGSNFEVTSSQGHIRDLSEKGLGIDFEHDYKPMYEVSPDKKKLVAELKKKAQKAKIVWLASDEDREGEAISWHLFDELKLNKENTRRIVFHEITKNAILHAVETPRDIDLNLVDAQQARRVLDRIVGFELSPVLWRKIKTGLSAGRVQSAAVRLIVDREREIRNFSATPEYRIVAEFVTDGKEVFSAELSQRFEDKADAVSFLEQCREFVFAVTDVQSKPAKRSPRPPFTTSTLQQEAAHRLGFTVSRTMRVAQTLYESGQITYMRTDSVNLSSLALGQAKKHIVESLGENYSQPRQFTTHSKGAQEAHEAIRPTNIANHTIKGTADEQRLYKLIWQRTIASQMADAQVMKTTADITAPQHKFVASGEVVTFDGFLRVYGDENSESAGERDAAAKLPNLKSGTPLEYKNVKAQQRYSQPPARYDEGSLVKKMEELGIGRPATYGPTISTIQSRKYVDRTNVEGQKREVNIVTLSKGKLTDQMKSETVGAAKNKLVPTDIGFVVNDFLMQYFPDIIDYNFTAQVEQDFDVIAEGKDKWTHVIDKFYKPFHKTVDSATQKAERNVGEHELGVDPATGQRVTVKIGRYGLIAQKEAKDENSKPQFAPLRKGQTLDNITLEEALELFRLPRTVGEFEGKEMVVNEGRFGPYVRHDGVFYSLPKGTDLFSVDAEQAIDVINEKRQAEAQKTINTFGNIQVLNGRYGPYITADGKNYKIPKGTDAKTLTEDDCKAIIALQPDAKLTRGGRKKK